MSSFTILSQADEDDLHAKRLLNIEEKPYKRVQKRLLAPTNPIQTYLRQPISTSSPSDENTTSDADIDIDDTTQDSNDVPNGAHAQNNPQKDTETYLKQLTTFTHQTLHDFSALKTSLARLQFLLNSNAAERERYTSQTTTITSQHTQITSETSELRKRLEEARSRLEQRKTYDELAKKVLHTNGRDGARSKTREELSRESERLRNEIEELEREGEELKGQWKERREALGKVNVETERLRRVVRGEPEVVEREDDTRSEDGAEDIEGEGEDQGEKRREEDEHTQHQQRDGDDHHDQEDDMLGIADRDRDGGAGGMSNAGTPRPIDDAPPTPTPVPAVGESGGMTPLPTGAMTPTSVAEHDDESASPAHENTIAGSGLKQEVHYDGGSEDGEDVSMLDQQQNATTVDVPEVVIQDGDLKKVEGMDTS